MSIEAVKTYLEPYGVAGRVQEFDVSSATVELAAQALGVEPARIAKTISLQSDGGCILVVAAGDAKLDNSKFKAEFHRKAKMLSADEVLPLTGYPVGGVCPFANPDTAAVYCDISLKRFSTVFPACGTPNSAIELSCEELFQYSHSQKWVDVCKNWDTEGTPHADAQ